MISAVNAFKAKLGVWTSHLGNRTLHHFPNLEKMSQAIEDKEAYHPEQSKESGFWGLVSREKFPLLTACALKVSAYFGSTYLCKMAFSQMKIIKSKYRSRLTDRHLTDCLRLAVCSYEPDYKALTDSVQPSH
ncbi:Protein FAM200A [Dissostichus eleginoides]|uniref:Protein FAM200A n=1 Tax=Dissostichus eleginoides TaxID=100907 RepID=A0AAD9BS17_DISEL|nr:Protein FAM200A [Dissostichus eleginoides]